MPRGRPKGSKNKTAQFLHYNPKKWEAWHESIVIRSYLGESNKDIAEKFGITPQHVSNILNCPQAQETKARLRQQILDEGKNVAEKVTGIQELAMKRMKEYLENDALISSNPHQTMDRALNAFKLTMPEEVPNVPATGPGSITNIQNNILIANPEYMERLSKGLEASNRIHEKAQLKLVSNE